jgi:hypothetical protein
MTPNSPDGTLFSECAGFRVITLRGRKPAAAEVRTNGFRINHAAGAQEAAKNYAAKEAER